MNKLIIEGVLPYDGTYEFEDFTSFTNRELHRIKKMTGIRVGEFAEALSAGDNDLLVALSTVILERSGVQVDDDILWDADAGALRLDFSGAEDPTQASPQVLESDSRTKTDDSLTPSGDDSSEPSETSPESDPSPTGDPTSETPTLAPVFDRSRLAS